MFNLIYIYVYGCVNVYLYVCMCKCVYIYEMCEEPMITILLRLNFGEH